MPRANRPAKETKVFYAYLDSANLRHLRGLARKHKSSMSKVMNTLIKAEKTGKKPAFTKGTRRTP
jgi:hypothetical protein